MNMNRKWVRIVAWLVAVAMVATSALIVIDLF